MFPSEPQGEFRLDGKTAVITGGGSGIGRAIALKFAVSGATVRILDVNLNDAEAVTKEIAGSQLHPNSNRLLHFLCLTCA